MHALRRTLAAATLAGTVLASPAGWCNLIVNGDFEADTIGGVNAAGGFEYRLALTGWTVNDVAGPIRGAVLFDDTYRPVGGGVNSLQIEDIGDSISQTISTVIGQLYELTFDLSAYSSPGNASVRVDLGGNTFDFSGTSAGYVGQSAQFTASSTSTLVSFTSVAPTTGVRYPHLDNIVIEAVPEPATVALLGLGVLATGAGRRRTRC